MALVNGDKVQVLSKWAWVRIMESMPELEFYKTGLTSRTETGLPPK